MALKRADIRTILENPETSNDDKAKTILDALHKETDELKDQLDAEKTARTQAEKDRDAANGGKQAAEKALTDYKAQQTKKDEMVQSFASGENQNVHELMIQLQKAGLAMSMTTSVRGKVLDMYKELVKMSF